MKIEKIEVFHMDIPLNPRDRRRLTFAGGMLNMDVAQDVVVKVYSEGICGIGMTSTVPPYMGAIQGAVSAAAKHLAGFIVGENPFRIEYINDVMDFNLPGNEQAKCAIDMALWDLLGKITGRPVYDLLGGKQRDSYVSTISLGVQSPEEMAQWAVERCGQGFKAFEVHIGDAPGMGVERDIKRLDAIRKAVGDDILFVGDGHRNFTVKESILAAEVLAPYNLVLEQPCRGIPALARVRAASKLHIGADEDCHTIQHTVDLIRQDAVDFITIKPMKAGGLTKAKRMAVLAESFGIMTRVDGVPGESKLSNGASGHLVLTLKQLVTCGTMQNIRLSRDPVTKGGMVFKDGMVSLPDTPGLGVEEFADDMLKPV